MNPLKSELNVYDCIIIGAGIAGLFAADSLRAQGLNGVILEKSRGLGGRMATRRMGDATLDHGAQFITAREAFLKDKIAAMVDQGFVTAWHENRQGVTRFRGTDGMTTIGQYLGRSLPILTEQTITHLQYEAGQWRVASSEGESFCSKALLSTIPTPQLLTLIKNSCLPMKPDLLHALEAIEYQPTIALLAILKEPSSMPQPGILKFKEHPQLETITDNQVKGISAIPALTIHSSLSFAQANLEHMNDATADELIQAAQQCIQFNIQSWTLHRWRYAQCTKRHPHNYVRCEEFPLWLAGDGFGNARLEQAAASGIEAAQSIMTSF